MKGYKFPDHQERMGTASTAKKALLEKFRSAQQDPALAEKLAARKALHDARETRMAEREAARQAREAELAEHKDRLLRFGAELVFAICEAKNVEVVILNQGEDTGFEEDLAKDVQDIVTVFGARLYGSRSRRHEKLLDRVKQAVDEPQP